MLEVLEILDTLLDSVPGSPMQHSSRAKVRASEEEDEAVGEHNSAL